LLFVENFSSPTRAQNMTSIRSARYQNNVTLEDERGALGSWYNPDSNAVAWVWIAGWPLGSQPHQTLGLRSVIPLLAALYVQGQGEKQYFFATH
jgi:hypothetical protein